MQTEIPAGSPYGRISESDAEKIRNRATKFFSTNRHLFTNYSMTHKDLIQECLLVAYEIVLMYPTKEGVELSKLIHQRVGWHLHNLFGSACRNKESAVGEISSPETVVDKTNPLEHFHTLTTLQKKVVGLKIEGMSLRETAEMIGCSFQRVDEVLKRAMTKIKQTITKGECDEGLKHYISPSIVELCKRSEVNG